MVRTFRFRRCAITSYRVGQPPPALDLSFTISLIDENEASEQSVRRVGVFLNPVRKKRNVVVKGSGKRERGSPGTAEKRNVAVDSSAA
ncbi:16021_t:CDS:2 [Acaulospora morrowiae]|uniref:16021_t:CDS:1 n=1 Tax=Acaulospora morrowiae TaxID=94023 RepID=A0A9N9F0S6_9GLOM|nr:16021_t:CDS:2 [Acaulospora morrowiae]